MARIVFQPIEEVLRVYFSKILCPGTKTSQPHSQEKVDRASLQQAADALISLLAVQCSLSIILLVFGPWYIELALQLLLPSHYLHTSAPDVLAAWIWYIPVLAINGGLEAFVSSAAMPKDVNRQSRYVMRPDYVINIPYTFLDGWLRFRLFL